MKKTTLALIFLLKLFSLHIYFVQVKRSIWDIDFIKHIKKTCETFTGRILFKNRNPSRAARFLDAGRSLHTPGLRYRLPMHWSHFTSKVLAEAIGVEVEAVCKYTASTSLNGALPIPAHKRPLT